MTEETVLVLRCCAPDGKSYQDGIEPNVLYRCDENGKLVRAS